MRDERRQPRSGPAAPRPSLLDLLRGAGGADVAARIQGLDERQVRWAVETGLAPLLARLVPAETGLARSDSWPLVRGTDLAARVGAADRLEAAAALLDACQGRVPPLALLKGLSLCTREYPEPHLRPMRDLDVLVEGDFLPEVEAALRALGYEPEAPPESYRGHHHLVPYVHPVTRVYVEVHHRLFPPHGALGRDPLFSVDAVARELGDSSLSGRGVRRLSVELQLVYVAAHWAASPKLVQGGGGLLPLLDVVYLLKKNEVRWPLVLGWLEGSAAAPGVYLLLAYASGRGLIVLPEGLLEALRRRQRAFNAPSLAAVFAIVDRCMVEGLPLAWPLGGTGVEVVWEAAFLAGPPWKNLARIPSLLARARGRATRGPHA